MANKYDLREALENNFKNSISTLKLTSLDDNTADNDYYLCANSLEVFNFDTIKNKIYPKGNKSPDAIYIKDKQVHVIEFKNQNPCDINSSDLKEKLKLSVDFFTTKIKYPSDYKFIFCLVYKKQAQHKNTQRYKHGVQNKACCSLSDTNKNDCNSFYKGIVTKDVEYYRNNFSELTC